MSTMYKPIYPITIIIFAYCLQENWKRNLLQGSPGGSIQPSIRPQPYSIQSVINIFILCQSIYIFIHSFLCSYIQVSILRYWCEKLLLSVEPPGADQDYLSIFLYLRDNPQTANFYRKIHGKMVPILALYIPWYSRKNRTNDQILIS